MPKDETYYFHQTPEALCKELIKHVPDLKQTDTFFEPFAGEGGWIKAFPEEANVIQTEIEHGTDYKSINLDTALVDWVITNPPFKLDNEKGKRENSFFKLVDYFAGKTKKGFAFLGNDYCLSAMTPVRLKKLHEKGVYIHKIVVCNIKKWKGRYFFIIFKNRCCSACKHKKIACCPKLTEVSIEKEEERVSIEKEKEEHEKKEKQRFDFFDFVEGTF
jgi:hypothetical protein